MRVLLDQLERSLDLEVYYLSLFTALTIPDIAGALDAANGRAKEEKYIRWYDEWVKPPPRFPYPHPLTGLPEQKPTNRLTGKDCYKFRCSLLHQGSSRPHYGSQFNRIIFFEPDAIGEVYDNVVNDMLQINVAIFCKCMIRAAKEWLDKVEGTKRFKTNYAKFARYPPDGMPGVTFVLRNGRPIPVIG